MGIVKKLVLVALDIPDHVMQELLVNFGEKFDFVSTKSDEEAMRYAPAADILVIDQPNRGIIAAAKNCSWLHCLSAGIERYLELESVSKNEKLLLTNSAGVYAVPVAEHTLAMILSFTRRIRMTIEDQRDRVWHHPSFVEQTENVTDLYGKTLGIVGLGHIGLEIAKRSKSFGMKVLGTKRNALSDLRIYGYERYVDSVYSPENVDKMLSESDIVVVSVPLTRETYHLFNRERFSKFKRNSIFVNVGRGKCVVEKDLVEALTSGIIRYVALDVFEKEPLPKESPLWSMSNVLVSPHYSGESDTSLLRSFQFFEENLKRYLEGQVLKNIVDKNAGY